MQFLEEAVYQQTVRTVVRKLIGSLPLPPEVVEVIAIEFLRQRGVPTYRFEDIWSAARTVVGQCQKQGKQRGSTPHTWANHGSTCLKLTRVEWWSTRHTWVLVHQSMKRKAVICPNTSCKGHHDKDFPEADWREIPDLNKSLGI